MRGGFLGAAIGLAVALAVAPIAHADPPASEGAPLAGEAFDALTMGKTFDTYGPSGLYGIEQFLPDHRSIWRDAEGCKAGRWEARDAQICFFYEDRPERAVCWLYKQRGSEIQGWYAGIFALPPVRLVETDQPLACDAPSV